jgi:hypothetical protein
MKWNLAHRFAICVLLAGIALTRPAAAHEGAGGNVGIGVGLGAPTALSLELAPVPWTSFELAIGMPWVAEGNMYGHLVYKLNVVRLVTGRPVVVPLYIGAGAFVHDHGQTDWGLRAPLGVDFDFTRVPVQLFAEVALEAVLASDGHVNDPISLAGFGGVRVWF